MGHIPHLRKQFKSTNPYDYIITLIRRRKKLYSFWKWMVPYLNELMSTSSKGALCQVWLKLAPWFWRGRFLNIINVFSLFRNYLPWKWVWILFTQDCLLASVVQIGTVVLEKKIFLILSIYFRFFVIIYPWKRATPFIWTNLNPLHPRMFCAKFLWNWSSSSDFRRRWKCLQRDK